MPWYVWLITAVYAAVVIGSWHWFATGCLQGIEEDKSAWQANRSYRVTADDRRHATIRGAVFALAWPLALVLGALMAVGAMMAATLKTETERAQKIDESVALVRRIAADNNLPFIDTTIIEPHDPNSDRPIYTITGNKYWICPGCHTMNYPGTGQRHGAECDYA